MKLNPSSTAKLPQFGAGTLRHSAICPEMLFGFGDGRQGDKLSEKEVEVEVLCVHKFFVFCSSLLLLYFFVGEGV